MEPIKAERQTVTFFEGLTVQGFRMPDGEFRVGITSVGEVLGYSRNWLPDALKGKSLYRLEALRGLGLTGNVLPVSTVTQRGTRKSKTISLRDFNRCISYAVFDGKKAALALQLALTEMALNDFFRDAFGETPLTVDEKRRLFYEAYASTISPEHWRQMDREDILKLALPGDEPHLRYGLWNE